jgi:RNase P/RNase MRP subunit p30
MIKKASKLGYGLVGVPFPARSNFPLETLRKVCEEAEIGLASRIDLKPRTPEELTYNLRKFRRRFEVVAVFCESKSVARQAARDRRVDLLNFPQVDFRRRFFDKAEAELASSSLAAFEVNVKPLLVLEGAARIRLLSSLRREVATAKESQVPIVVSSGATDEILMRRPSGLTALASLFDLDKTSANEAVSKNPIGIVQKNRKKLDSRFVAPGIRVVRRGKDC